MIAVTGDTFDAEVVRSNQPVLVDFWGPRCGPCLALMPLVEELARQYDGRLRVVKVNSAENRRLCAQLRVMSLPTFLLYHGGHELDRLSRDVKANDLQLWVEKTLSQQA